MKTGERLSRAPGGKPATVALVGCGAVAQRYYGPALQALEAAGWLRVVALHDPNPAMRQTLRQRFPTAHEAEVFAAAYADAPELAIVASPPAVHAEQSIELLRAGVSVLCEKPLARTVAEAEAMIAAAADASAVLAVGMVRRHFPATQKIHELLAASALGSDITFDVQEGVVFRWPVASAAYFQKTSGGVLMDIGVHALDLLIWWFGEPVEIAYEDDAMGGIEVNCRLRCQFASGVRGELRLSRDCALPNHYVLRGTEGTIRWPVNEANRLEIGSRRSPYVLNAQLEEDGAPAAPFEQSFMQQICNVIEAVRGDAEPRVSAADALGSLRAIERCYRHRKPMPMPWLAPGEASRAALLNGRS